MPGGINNREEGICFNKETTLSARVLRDQMQAIIPLQKLSTSHL